MQKELLSLTNETRIFANNWHVGTLFAQSLPPIATRDGWLHLALTKQHLRDLTKQVQLRCCTNPTDRDDFAAVKINHSYVQTHRKCIIVGESTPMHAAAQLKRKADPILLYPWKYCVSLLRQVGCVERQIEGIVTHCYVKEVRHGHFLAFNIQIAYFWGKW